MRNPVRISAIASAGLIGALTVSVFAALSKMDSPESAVKNLHQAVQMNDMEGVRKVMQPELQYRGASQRLVTLIEQAMAQGVDIEIQTAIRTPNRPVVVPVQYRFRNGRVAVWLWAVARSSGTWMIDPDSTIDVNRPM